MMNYINIHKKKVVGRNNNVVPPITMDYSTVEEVSFQLIDDKNQIQHLEALSGLYFAGSLGIGQQSYDLLFLSKDYVIENDIITFQVDTYTRNWLDRIKKKNTEINIEIGQASLNAKKVMMRGTALAFPRVYVAGLSPQEIDSHDYYTKEEVDELIDGIIVPTKLSELENDVGYITEESLDGYQEKITADSKLAYGLISGAPAIPTKTSDLDNDSGFITDAALSSKQDLITAEAKLAYGLISGTPSIPTKTSDLENDSGFQTAVDVQTAISGKADESALTAHTSDTVIHVTATDKTTWNGKQDAITAENKLDYALLSGTPTIPTKTSDLQNDSNFATSGYVQEETSGKLTAPSGGTEGQVLKKTTSGTEWADESGGGSAEASVNVSLEEKSLGQDTSYKVDFTGKQIQKYKVDSAASDSIEISFENLEQAPSGCAPTVELQIPALSEVSTITLPSSVQVIDMPDSLEGGEEARASIRYAYHDIVFRSEKDVNGEWKTYVNYAYKFDENKQVEDTRDYFYIEALEDDSTITVSNYNSSCNLSASVGDINHWEVLTGSTISIGVPSGTKVYVIGNTTTLHSGHGLQGISIGSNKNFAIGGRIFSLYSDMLQPKELTNPYDSANLYYNNKKILRCSADLSSLSSLFQAFSNCINLTTIANGFKCPDVVNAGWMFEDCGNLSGLPAGFTLPNATNTSYTFNACGNLSGLPDGFSCPNSTNTESMFTRCGSLSGLPDGFSCPNTANAFSMFADCGNLLGLPVGFTLPNATDTHNMFSNCGKLSGLPDGFSCPNTTNAGSMFSMCNSLTTIGNNVKIANGPNATSNDDTSINKSLITTIGDNFEWFTNATFNGTWDPALGIKNVFQNATTVGSGWKVYDHYDGE